MTVEKVEVKATEGNLSEEQIAKLGEEAIQEAEAIELTDDEKAAKAAEEAAHEAETAEEREARLKEKDVKVETEAEKAEREKSEKLTAEQKAEEAMRAEETRLLALDDKDEKVSKEDKQKKIDLVKLQTETKAKAEQQELETYSRENSVSVEDAKKDFESIKAIQDKYKGDPKQLAKAGLHLQRAYMKAIEQNKQLQAGINAQAEPTVNTVITMLDKGMLKTPKGEVMTKEGYIEAYRKLKPDITQDLDDNKVLTLAAENHLTNFKSLREKFNSELASKAEAKKANLLSILPESDRKYLEDVKPVLDKLTPNQIMSESLSINDMIMWAKGVHHDEDVRAADEAGFKRGMEQARILGVKTGGGKGSPASGDVKKKTYSLSDAQKEQALDMYESATSMSDDEKYEAFAELMELDKPKKKK